VETLVQSSGGSLRARSKFNGVIALGEKKESKLLTSLEARKRCMHLNRIVTHMSAGQAVAAHGDGAIRIIAAERVDDKFRPSAR
jgi:butyrate kinase